jgi:hypothetical protein
MSPHSRHSHSPLAAERRSASKAYSWAVRKPLGLTTDRTDLDPLIANDVRKILSGLATVVEGIARCAAMAATLTQRARLHDDRPQGREPCGPFGEHDRTLPDRDVAKKISDA